MKPAINEAGRKACRQDAHAAAIMRFDEAVNRQAQQGRNFTKIRAIKAHRDPMRPALAGRVIPAQAQSQFTRKTRHTHLCRVIAHQYRNQARHDLDHPSDAISIQPRCEDQRGPVGGIIKALSKADQQGAIAQWHDLGQSRPVAVTARQGLV